MVYIKKLVMQGFKSFAQKTEIIFDKGINVIIGPNGSGKSCSYDTIVTLADGTEREIGNLIEKQIAKATEVKNIDDGVYVDGDNSIEIISLNKITMKSEKKKISKFIKREGDDLYRIRTRSGRELKATKCHPIMSFVDGKVESKIISDLDVGGFVAVPRIIEIDSNKHDPEFARLMGYIIGDGYIANDRIEFVNQDPEILEDYERLIGERVSWGIRKRSNVNATRVYSRDKAFYAKIRELYGKDTKTITSSSKCIPNYFLGLDNESVANLLAGLFDTDGSVRKNIGTIEYCTKNKQLARQVQSLLLRFGILSKIKRRMNCATNTENKTKHEYFYLYIYGAENIRSFYESIPLRVTHKKDNLRRIVEKRQIANNNVDLLPQEINLKVKELVRLLGIKVKPLKKEYPLLSAYCDNVCAPSRQGIKRVLEICNQKFALLHEKYHSLGLEQHNLIEFMDMLNLSAPQTSMAIGLNKEIIRNVWATGKYTARTENVQLLKSYVVKSFLTRIQKISEILTLLHNLSHSDILWDEIVSIEKLDKPAFVYDLTIEGNHNFVANSIFAHNSNISDALCFVLGRISSKSMRASKTRNLLFMGTKYVKPSHEAHVEIVFDNSDRVFAMERDEVSIARSVRNNGLSVYKINGETKTRGEVLEALAQAGIDPHGFNLILQGQIQAIVKMHPEERREVLEEVAGIAVYESRKEKSLHELGRTDDRLKEINAILRERTAFLRNLENERAQALKFKELELTIKRCKASLLTRRINDKIKEITALGKSIQEQGEKKEKMRDSIQNIQGEIDEINSRIGEINKHIQRATGIEQETLRNQIANLRAELEGAKVRRENYINKREEIQRRIEEIQKNIPEFEKEIKRLKIETPILVKKREELAKKKDELEKIEEERRRIYAVKTELNSLRERIKDRQITLAKNAHDSSAILKQIEDYTISLSYDNVESCRANLKRIEGQIVEQKQILLNFNKEEIELTRIVSSFESEIRSSDRVKEQIKKIDICPLCKNKMTEEHVSHVLRDANQTLENARKKIEESQHKIEVIIEKRHEKNALVGEFEKEQYKLERELTQHLIIKDKHEQLKKIVAHESQIKREIVGLEEQRSKLEQRASDLNRIEELYGTKMIEIEEASSMTADDVDRIAIMKERELEKMKEIIKHAKRDYDSMQAEINDIELKMKERINLLAEKEASENAMNEQFKKLFKERDELQHKTQEGNYELTTRQSEWRQIEEQINYIKVGDAKLRAEKEAVEMEMIEFQGIELVNASPAQIEERLSKSQETIKTIGSINMRALEIYDEIRKEYERVQEKVNTLQKEKEDIMSIISEIDAKKKKTFMRTFHGINEKFTSNFSRLSSKGQAFLQIENEESIFEGGVNIVIRLGKGKFFDVTSLSGGEQTLIALSLLFAIQEFKPYHFYVFDEIDAALDKRNSERLSALLMQYMKSGQYITITHNDALIMDANLLYGVSMHDGVSKVLSLKVS
ncbi:MAG: LAGLIDADG family homing endonuclease [Nanoarchaeota archaeon]